MPVTGNLSLRYPAASAAPNVPQDVQNLAADVDAIGGAWISYSPIWSSSGTQPVQNNGTLTGNYRQIGKIAFVRVVLTIGSTTTIGSGVYRFSLPASAAPKVNSLLPALFVDQSDGARLYPCTVRVIAATSTGDNMRIAVAGNAASLGATVPAVPATGDVIIIDGSYEVI